MKLETEGDSRADISYPTKPFIWYGEYGGDVSLGTNVTLYLDKLTIEDKGITYCLRGVTIKGDAESIVVRYVGG